MRKQIVIVVGVAALGLGYSLFSSMTKRDDAVTPALMPEVSEPRGAPPVVRETTVPPAEAPMEVAAETEVLAEFDADGDDHDHDVGEAAELEELQLPPELPDEDPDPIIGELAALQEARAIVQGLLSEQAMDPATREQAEELLEIIDSQGQ